MWREYNASVPTAGGVPLDAGQHDSRCPPLTQIRDHVMLLEKHWLLTVIGQGDKVQPPVDVLNVCADLGCIFAVRVQVAAQPGPWTCISTCGRNRHGR